MPVYEAAFLGEPNPIKPKPKGRKKKSDPAPLPPKDEPVSEPAPVSVPAPQAPVEVQTPAPTPAPSGPAPKKRVRKAVAVPVRIEETPVPEKKRKLAKKSVIVDGEVASEAPAWFKAHLMEEAKKKNAEKPKAERVPQAQVKAAVVPQQSYSAHKEKVDRVDNSMQRLYRQIHGR
jgi:polyhydroxyalkanoate synthesis regulator phasin